MNEQSYTEQSDIRVGQVWKDWDVRYRRANPGRLLIVDSISGGFAHCTIFGTSRRTRISLQRMKPTSTGYMLVKEAEDTRI